jgi:phage terminase large subunit GpA-like protein
MSDQHPPIQHREAGKGSTTRPTNHTAFSEGMDRIFGQRGKVKCPDCGQEFWLRSDAPHNHTCAPKGEQ